MTVKSDFAGDVDSEPGEPSLPSWVHLDMSYVADSDSVTQVSDCVNFGEPGSGTFSPESGNVTAVSDFAGDIDPGPGEPLLPSGVHLDMPDLADVVGVSQVSDCVNFGEPRSGTTPPPPPGVREYDGDVRCRPSGPLLGSAVIFDRQSFVSDCEQIQTWDCICSILGICVMCRRGLCFMP